MSKPRLKLIGCSRGLHTQKLGKVLYESWLANQLGPVTRSEQGGAVLYVNAQTKHMASVSSDCVLMATVVAWSWP